VIKPVKMLAILCLSAVFSLATQAQTDSQRAEIEARIKPPGEVCLQGDASCAGAAANTDSGGDARSGEVVYNESCMVCHASGVAGAPKLGDAAAWADRIAKGRDALHDTGLNGLAGTGMMARGGCGNCSDDEVRAAVDYMIDNSQ
jgi:cytochrome c5